ncbi:MAG: flagellar protein FlaG [Pseudomonadota bacterium]
MQEIKTVDTAQTLGANGRGVANAAENTAKTASSRGPSGNVLPANTPESAPTRPSQPSAAASVAAEFSADREKRVEQAVEQLNDYVQSLQRDLRFSVDEKLGRAVVHVVDGNTQEVIRQIPNETALRLARNLKEVRDTQSARQLQDLHSAGASGATASADGRLGLINTRI